MTHVSTREPNGRLALRLGALLRMPNGQQALAHIASFFDQQPMSSSVPAILPKLKAFQAKPLTLGRMVLPKTETRTIQGVEGTLTNYGHNAQFQEIGDFELTFGGTPPRFINAATLKQLAGKPRASLLRQDGAVWRVCPNSWRIDLTDETVVYRLGDVQIYS